MYNTFIYITNITYIHISKYIHNIGTLTNYTSESSSKKYDQKLDREAKHQVNLRGYIIVNIPEKFQFLLESNGTVNMVLQVNNKDHYNSWSRAFKGRV